jgi:hypothetical protein
VVEGFAWLGLTVLMGGKVQRLCGLFAERGNGTEMILLFFFLFSLDRVVM